MKRRILLIDDHLPSRSFVLQALNNKGFAVVGEGTSGREALVLARTTRPDAILMAVGLPDMDGIRVAKSLMQQSPLPIILLTSHHDTEAVQRAKEAGIMAYLIKPLRTEELAPTIEMAVSRFAEFLSLRKQNEDLTKTLESRKAIERAKGILMRSQGLSEGEAFALIQKKSMDLRKPMADIAQAIILTAGMTREKTP